MFGEAGTITGTDGRAVEVVRHSCGSKTRHVALAFPGRGYTCDMPGMLYTRTTLLEADADVLEVRYRYDEIFEGEYTPESITELWHLIEGDARAAVDAALPGYERVTLAGKSLGTRAIERILTRNMLGDTPVRVISLTPLLTDDATFQCFRDWPGEALHVIGTADDHYVADRVAQLDNVLVLDDVDHGLWVDNDTVRSVQAMARIVAAIRGFLA